MNTKTDPSRLALIGVMLLFVLACSVSTSQPVSAPVQAKTKTSAPPSTKSYPSATLRPVNTATRTPTRIPTKIPTRTPAKTQLPPLPDFEDVITFAAGAGGGPCSEIDEPPNYLDVWVNSAGVHMIACFWLRGIDVSRPLEINLSQPGNSTGVYFESPTLFLDSNNARVLGEGYSTQQYFGNWYRQNNEVIKGYFNVWSSIRLSPGMWRFSITQTGSAFGTLSSDFRFDADGRPFLSVLSSRNKNELIGGSTPYNIYHLIRSKGNGKVDVIGTDFPPNVPIYILLYRAIPNSFEMELMQKQVIQSDFHGTLATELEGPFASGQLYVIVALSDPNLPLQEYGENGYHNFNWNLPFDSFEVESQNSNSGFPGSCPGAPPQRLVVNQRAYVCTQSDRVRLRNAPAKSASTIVYVNTGTQFTVIGGPSCSDSWSWWNVRLDDGTTGWLSEGGDTVDPYFICPVP